MSGDQSSSIFQGQLPRDSKDAKSTIRRYCSQLETTESVDHLLKLVNEMAAAADDDDHHPPIDTAAVTDKAKLCHLLATHVGMRELHDIRKVALADMDPRECRFRRKIQEFQEIIDDRVKFNSRFQSPITYMSRSDLVSRIVQLQRLDHELLDLPIPEGLNPEKHSVLRHLRRNITIQVGRWSTYYESALKREYVVKINK